MDFYKKASDALEKVLTKKTSVKSFAHSKRLLALILETLKYQDVIKQLIDITDLMNKEKKAIKFAKPQGNPIYLLMVLLHDLLFSRRQAIEAGQGPIKDAILRHKTRLRGELTKIRVKAGVSSNLELARKAESGAEMIPRYVRINTNRIKFDDAIKKISDNFKLESYTGSDMPIPSNKYKVIEHIPGLIAVNTSISQQLTSDKMYTNGEIILQDLASCMPPIVLLDELQKGNNKGKRKADNDNHVGTVIDGTAAPGNKTTLLSALLGNEGKVLAFEHVPKRFETLEKMVKTAGCANVTCNLGDFTKCDPASHPDVTHILLDPSCTGSGIVNRLDYLTEQENDDKDAHDERLNSLAAFQEMIIGHAMKFPNVRRIVYSTCSIHDDENEMVVMNTLTQHPEFELASRETCLPGWPTRGHPEPFNNDVKLADSVIRCKPGTDLTNGFFVACFEKRQNIDNQGPSKKRKNKKKNASSKAEN
ncbi:S-adenosyl-L-methionine-dependent methyltransferase [Wallemia mellicola CBS 633.66]|uniref:S-adenosyl-L-methionine-dependent methyltransferase n=1 Tax=Wallemia mellicola (strain ATCC MYA-4683 / CBS 633.66) TaxID=671144 RepID=I4Y5M9_WALMC|nr:S-adenosyl-L-methionine-dependent methyltransferase [Wallemia mellicola CBS 633.66]EIM19271.1 S-adenosyl-L-methionine-dependent methyltransferase [Wallemia mellicola CBS 633.66]|eukprot:XP_006960665.1 S-adenosyl-L-methionine-dependent methyltransferase [Wallemia mellicola CBS 633.66]